MKEFLLKHFLVTTFLCGLLGYFAGMQIAKHYPLVRVDPIIIQAPCHKLVTA